MSGVLAGIRVLDFGRYIAGPFCAALLSDLGAEVIRIEQPSGGEDRFLLPIGSDEGGVVMMQVGRNKKGMTLNLASEEAAGIIARLVQSADVVIANLPPPVLKKIGLDYESLKAIKENIILTTTTAFGEGGPYSNKVGFDGVAQAMSGTMYLTGEPDQPMKASVSYVDYATASLSAFSTLAALYEVKGGGQGQHVETSLLSTAITIGSGSITEQAQIKTNRVASGNRAQAAGPADCFQTKDGWLMVQLIGPHMFKRWTELVDAPDLLNDSRFKDDLSRGENGAILSDIMSSWCIQHTTQEALDKLEQLKIPVGEVLSPQRVIENEHVIATKQFKEVAFPGLSKPALLSNPPFKMSGTPAKSIERAPLLGEHTDSLLAELGYSGDQIQGFRNNKVV